MAQINPMIPLAARAPNVADALLSGLKVGNALTGGGEQMTPYQRQMLALQYAKLQQAGQLTPYQRRALELRERALNQMQARAEAPRVGLTLESIRSKLARGEALQPGEQKVYDDAQRLSVFERMLLDGGAPAPQAGLPGPAPQYARPFRSSPELDAAPLAFESNPQQRRIGQVYNLPGGRRGRWQQDAQGNTGWELLD